jgi:hypothetical protein
MFVLGVIAQWFTNRVSGPVEPRELFLYTAVFLFGFPFEVDAFALWVTLIKFLAILCAVRWLVYGPRRDVPRVQ